MEFNLNLSCERTGREAAYKLKTTEGEEIANEMIYGRKSINVASMMDEYDMKEITSVNLQTGRVTKSDQRKPMEINENGLHLVMMERSNGERILQWLFKTAPDYVNTTDYDPILTNPMDQKSVLDLSLLEEEVMQIAIVDHEGTEHLLIEPEAGASSIDIHRTASMLDGEYTVEVRTSKNNFPLILKVSSDLGDAVMEVFPNPANDQINISTRDSRQVTSVMIYGMDGKVVLDQDVSASAELVVDVSHLPISVYKVETIFEDGTSAASIFVKQ